MISIRRSRLLISSPLLILALLGFAWLLRSSPELIQRPFALFSPPGNRTKIDSGTLNTSSTYDPALIPYWNLLSKALIDAKPQCSLPEDPIKAPINKFAGLKKSSSKRPDLLKIPQQDVDDLRDAHGRYVSQLPELAAKLPYAKGTKGIVTTAAGDYLPVLVVSLRMLRRTGSKLPIEVYMQSRDVYEQDVCERILPSLNATCWLMSVVLDKVPQKLELAEGQLKAFAMVFSSFDEVVWMDPDNIAVEAPERLLEGEPFVEMGFVSWPDYWANTASPKYYEISSQPIPLVLERAASESGQLLLSKSKHASTLLLALYYSYYGPSHYFRLLLQGGPGRGEKETYLAAAMALNSTFHTVHTNVEILGYHNDDNQFRDCGDVQHNSIDDFQKHILRNTTNKEVRRAFVHAQTYRMDAAKAPERFHNEINQRMWGPKEDMVKRFGRDLEKQLWAETLYTGCHLEASFKTWENSTGVCKKIGRVYKFLFD